MFNIFRNTRIVLLILLFGIIKTIDASNIEDSPPPPIPSAKAATNITQTSFTANWGASTGATKYYLDVAKNSSFTTYVTGYQNLDVGNTVSRSVSGLSASTTYYYRVRAYNSSGTSGNSGTITITTLSAIPPIPVPKAATNITQTSFTANWNVSTGATKYYLDVAKNSSFTTYVTGYQNLDVGNTVSRSVSGLSASTTYYYRVRAYNSSGTSGNSGTITVTTLSAIPPTPVLGQASNITQGSFVINWSISTGATKYFVDVALNNSFSQFVPGFNNYETPLNFVTVRGLDPMKPYYVRVRASNVFGTSNNSSVSTVATGQATYGLTVLVHGYVLLGQDNSDNTNSSKFSSPTTYDPIVSYWTTNHIAGLLRRMGGGKVYRYDSQTLSFVDVTGNYPEFNPYNYSNREKILVFDWSQASNDNASVHAEAAAEALFVALLRGNFISLTQSLPNSSMHFIGHSRGTVVASECIQRLGYYGIPVAYVTNLDPHDYDEDWIPYDNSFNDPAVQIWSQTKYADNFWQDASGIFAGTLNPSGRSLDQLVVGYDYNRQLDNLAGFGSNGSHSLVKDYYFGTVIPGTKDPTWYYDKTGANTGLSLWLSLGGHSSNGSTNCFNSSRPKTNEKTMANLIRFPASGTNNDDDFARPLFSNGQFATLFQGTSNSSNEIGGWSYFGGGYSVPIVNPQVKIENGVMKFDCFPVIGSTSYRMTHNWVQIPNSTSSLSLQYKITRSTAPANSSKIRLYLLTQENTTVALEEINLNQVTSWNSKSYSLSSYKNKRVKLIIEYVKEANATTTGIVELDNFDIIISSGSPDLAAGNGMDDIESLQTMNKQKEQEGKSSDESKNKKDSENEVVLSTNNQLSLNNSIANDDEQMKSDQSVNSHDFIPLNFYLSQNYPNPFNPLTVVRFGVPEESEVKIEIFSLTGELINVLLKEVKQPGNYTLSLDLGQMNSGIYLLRMISNDFISTRKIILMK